MERDSMIFYRSFYEALQVLDVATRCEIYDAVLRYGLDGTETEGMSPTAQVVMMLIRPQIDANNRRFENGKKGGRPKGSREEEGVSKERKRAQEAQQNGEATKTSTKDNKKQNPPPQEALNNTDDKDPDTKSGERKKSVVYGYKIDTYKDDLFRAENIEGVCMTLRISPSEYQRYKEMFYELQREGGETYSSGNEVRRHWSHWLRRQVEADKHRATLKGVKQAQTPYVHIQTEDVEY